jgi:plasmid stabilization system protein ParE
MLRKAIASLGSEYDKGGLIDADHDLRYLLVRRKKSGHGHILVYRVHAENVDVLHVLHTAQDWRSKPLDDIEP